MAENIIQVDGLTKKFGDFTAVNKISFNIKKGEILGFLGPNGAGKTTTIKMMNGLLKITQGKILIKGMDAERHRIQVKTLMGYMSQKFSLYPLLNALENIRFFGGVSGLSAGQIREKQEWIEQREDPVLLRQKVADIPPGIKQKIALYVCLMTNPEIIFLDEPTSGVDPEVRRSFWFEIYRLKKLGKTILVSTHNLDEVEYADRMIIIHRGNIILEGEPETLRLRYQADSMESLFKMAIVNADRESGILGAVEP